MPEDRRWQTRVGLDLYHWLLRLRWPSAIALLALGFLGTNALFAALFLLGGDCVEGARPGNFLDYFFFSVQTLSTIGYGGMSPKTPYAHTVVTLVSFAQVVSFAVVTGLVFARFARPKARVSFSNYAVISPRDGQPVLMVRMANERGNRVLSASVELTFLRNATTAEGETYRALCDLPLIRTTTPAFGLSFTAVHPVDAQSPLHGMDAEALRAVGGELVIVLTGVDETYGQSIIARNVWPADRILWNRRFSDILRLEADGSHRVDFERFHDVESAEDANPSGRGPMVG